MTVEQYSLSRTGLEVYKTKEEVEIEEQPSSDENEETTEDTTNNEGFKLLNGEIEEIYHYGDFYSNTFEEDYEDISSNAGVVFNTVDKLQVYKGRKVCLKKAWNPKTWKDLKTLLLGFITEQKYSQDKVELRFVGMNKLMEQQAQFDFKQMKRSEIIIAIIEAAGLTAEVDATGLIDDVIDYSNKGSSSKNDSGDSGLPGGQGERIDTLVKQICKGIKGDLEKAKAIHKWLQENVKYAFYECSKYHTPEECLDHKGALNCADTARLTRAMMASAGLTCYVVHGPYHFWTMIEIGGKKYASDQTGSGSPFNTVWWRGRGRGTAIPPYSKNGDNPSC